LLDTAKNNREEAAARHGIGWAEFAAADYQAAEANFRAAVDKRANDAAYHLGLAWAITRQPGKSPWQEAEHEARWVAGRRRDPLAETCLGIVASQRQQRAEAEHYFKKALKLDPNGSQTDLGALYVRMARYDQAETELLRAIKRDPLDAAAHIELGFLYLQPGYEQLPAAEREFGQVRANQPASVQAAIGQAQAFARAARDTEAESVLRRALRQASEERWRAHLALTRLLVLQGNEQQDPDLLSEAYAQATTAIKEAKGARNRISEQEMAELEFAAGAALFHLASMTPETPQRYLTQRRALHQLDRCLQEDPDHVEALRYRRALKRVIKPTRQGLVAVGLTALLAFTLLALQWSLFLTSTKISPTLISVDTPILAGLFMVSFLLPTLIHIKMPGFEAAIQPTPENIAPGPTGSDAFGPGKFTVTAGPTGQIPRRGADPPLKHRAIR
jgi:Flp pilus assembly protein TadD